MLKISPIYLTVLSITLIIFNTPTWAQTDDYDWTEKRNRNGISIATSKVHNSKYHAVRFKTLIEGKLNSVIGLILDNPACQDWVEMCKESRVVKAISDTESYIYTYNDLPFPLKDRDVIAHVVWQQDIDTGTVTMNSTAIDSDIEQSKAIRLEQATATWHFTPQTDNRVLVEGYAHVDPNGPIPSWLTNLMLVKSPYKTMKNMHKIITSGRYDNYKVPFLQ